MERGQGPLWIARRGKPSPMTKVAETSVPRCYSHAQTEWKKGLFWFFLRVYRNLSPPPHPRARKGDTPDLKLRWKLWV